VGKEFNVTKMQKCLGVPTRCIPTYCSIEKERHHNRSVKALKLYTVWLIKGWRKIMRDFPGNVGEKMDRKDLFVIGVRCSGN
jgi:hypothetical protein